MRGPITSWFSEFGTGQKVLQVLGSLEGCSDVVSVYLSGCDRPTKQVPIAVGKVCKAFETRGVEGGEDGGVLSVFFITLGGIVKEFLPFLHSGLLEGFGYQVRWVAPPDKMFAPYRAGFHKVLWVTAYSPYAKELAIRDAFLAMLWVG